VKAVFGRTSNHLNHWRPSRCGLKLNEVVQGNREHLELVKKKLKRICRIRAGGRHPAFVPVQ